MTIGQICNREVTIVMPDTSLAECAKLMRQYHVGDLVVVQDDHGVNKPVGILTDRDLVIEIIAKGIALDAVVAGDIMSDQLLCLSEAEDVDAAIEKMRDRGVRRAPVINDQDVLVGIISMDDIIDLFAERLENLAALVKKEHRRESRIRQAV